MPLQDWTWPAINHSRSYNQPSICEQRSSRWLYTVRPFFDFDKTMMYGGRAVGETSWDNCFVGCSLPDHAVPSLKVMAYWAFGSTCDHNRAVTRNSVIDQNLFVAFKWRTTFLGGFFFFCDVQIRRINTQRERIFWNLKGGASISGEWIVRSHYHDADRRTGGVEFEYKVTGVVSVRETETSWAS